jgi:hypothetical protein
MGKEMTDSLLHGCRIADIASPFSGNGQFPPDPILFLENHDRPTLTGSSYSSHKPGGTAADYDDG